MYRPPDTMVRADDLGIVCTNPSILQHPFAVNLYEYPAMPSVALREKLWPLNLGSSMKYMCAMKCI